jgi:hypothetical protein
MLSAAFSRAKTVVVPLHLAAIETRLFFRL